MAQNGNLTIDISEISTMLQEKTREGLFLNHRFSIYRVPAHIRKNNKSYYEPRMVSIGPYHQKKDHLHAMEEHKWRYLNEFIKKKDGILNKCMKEMRDLEAKSLACYFENVYLKSYQFVEMMLLDSCFIIQLFIKWRYNEKDALLHVGWASPLLLSDLLMLENQIPFFLLTKMYEIYTYVHDFPPIAPGVTQEDKWPSFITLIEDTLRSRHLIPERNETEGKSKDLEDDVPKHLLDCFYRILIPSQVSAQKDEEPQIQRPMNIEERSINQETNEPTHLQTLFDYLFVGTQISTEQKKTGLETSRPTNAKRNGWKFCVNISFLFQKCNPRGFCGSKKSSKKRRSPIVIPSAIELQEFGVTLVKKEKFNSFLDISFKGGTLEVPKYCFTIEDSSRSRILNLIAFEQCNDADVDPIKKPLASYAAFMACLMNTSEDVLIVERAEIIENNLANSKEGAKFFRQLRQFAHIEVDSHYLRQIFIEVNDHCHAFWPKHKARLRHDYFSSPWTVFSLGAALLVLSFTIFRTVCFILIHFFHDLK